MRKRVGKGSSESLRLDVNFVYLQADSTTPFFRAKGSAFCHYDVLPFLFFEEQKNIDRYSFVYSIYKYINTTAGKVL